MHGRMMSCSWIELHGITGMAPVLFMHGAAAAAAYPFSMSGFTMAVGSSPGFGDQCCLPRP